MSGYRLVPFPSRINDRTFTRVAVDRARVACGSDDLLDAVGSVALALDTVTALHPQSRHWPSWQEVDRCWWSMRSAVETLQPRAVQGRLLAQGLLAVLGLVSSLEQADADETTLLEVERMEAL